MDQADSLPGEGRQTSSAQSTPTAKLIRQLQRKGRQERQQAETFKTAKIRKPLCTTSSGSRANLSLLRRQVFIRAHSNKRTVGQDGNTVLRVQRFR